MEVKIFNEIVSKYGYKPVGNIELTTTTTPEPVEPGEPVPLYWTALKRDIEGLQWADKKIDFCNFMMDKLERHCFPTAKPTEGHVLQRLRVFRDHLQGQERDRIDKRNRAEIEHTDKLHKAEIEQLLRQKSADIPEELRELKIENGRIDNDGVRSLGGYFRGKNLKRYEQYKVSVAAGISEYDMYLSMNEKEPLSWHSFKKELSRIKKNQQREKTGRLCVTPGLPPTTTD
jgi:hypothetical protein